jgi:hypothetical protein
MSVLTSLTPLLFPMVCIAGEFDTAVEGLGIASALGGHLTTLASGFRYARGFCDVGSNDSTANILTNEASLSDKRMSPWYGLHLLDSALPFEGFAVRRTSCVASAAARAARLLISTDMARYAEGSLGGVRKIEFDGNADQTLDAVRISTLRTHAGVPGFYIGQGRLKSPPGSDFVKVQYGRVMDRACRAIYEAMQPFLAEGFRTNSDGTIFENDAADVQSAGNAVLDAILNSPNNARGTRGHVSAAKFFVDRAHNLNTTGTIKTRTAIRPLGYADFIEQEIGFTLNV